MLCVVWLLLSVAVSTSRCCVHPDTAPPFISYHYISRLQLTSDKHKPAIVATMLDIRYSFGLRGLGVDISNQRGYLWLLLKLI